jgi:PAS domain S-box-containing protein
MRGLAGAHACPAGTIEGDQMKRRSADPALRGADGAALGDLPRNVLDNLLEGCQVIGRDWRYLYVNDALAAQGRTTKEQLLGRTLSEAYPGIEDTPLFSVLRRCMDDRSPRRMDTEFTFPDGSKGWFELRFEPVPAGVCILSVDVTERRRADEALRRSNRALAMLSEGNQAIIRAADESQLLDQLCTLVVEKGGYLRAWIALLPESDLRRPSTRRAEDPGSEPAVESLIHASRRSGPVRAPSDGHFWTTGPTQRTLRTGKVSITRIAGSHQRSRWNAEASKLGVAAGIALPLHEGQELVGALTVCAAEPDAFDDDERALLVEMANDLSYGLTTVRARTAQRHTEDELRQAQRLEAIGRLAGGVAHDFNNLLSVILTFSDLALDEIREGDPLREDLGEIRKAAASAASLTRQLLAFSRKQMLNLEVVSFNELLLPMEDMLRRLIGEDIELTMLLTPDLGNVKADAGQIEQVLMNLVVNSRDAMPKGGKLIIETANVELDRDYATQHMTVEPGPYVMLSVTDTGCGMDEETKSHIFEPFFTTKEVGKGTGLGLPMVYGVVNQSGGNIWVYSEPGRGTVFKVYFPRVLTEAEALAPRASTRPSGTETILLVEDDAAVRAAARRVLGAAGYTVLTASNGGEALLTCEQHPGPIHLMLTDIVMPRMNGIELAQRLGSVRPRLDVLFMSGYTEYAVLQSGVLDPRTHFIAKPFTGADLSRKVREVLDAVARD